MKRFSRLPDILTGILLFFIATTQAQVTYPSNIIEDSVGTYTLPDVLKTPNGKRVTNSEEWKKLQRPYIYHLFETYQFGRMPGPANDTKVRIDIDKHALGGIATRKQWRIFLLPDTDSTVYVDVLIYLPN